MTKPQSAIDKNYKLRVSPKESKAVQKVCFENDIFRTGNRTKKVRDTNLKAIYVFGDPSDGYDRDFCLGNWSDQDNDFPEEEFETEITPAEFIKKFRKKEPEFKIQKEPYGDLVFDDKLEKAIKKYVHKEAIRLSKELTKSLEASHRCNFPKK